MELARLAGSAVNIPIGRFRDSATVMEPHVSAFGAPYLVAVAPSRVTLLTVNLGAR